MDRARLPQDKWMIAAATGAIIGALLTGRPWAAVLVLAVFVLLGATAGWRNDR